MKIIFSCTGRSRSICFTCVLFLLVISANAQSLNETYLHAKADMIRKEYVDAAQRILSIPERDRTSSMYLTLGECYYLANRYVEAARYFARADSAGANPEAQIYAARACAMLQQPADAVAWLQKYLSQRDKLSESEITLDPAFEKLERSREWRELWDREWYNAADRREAEAAILLRRNRHTEALAVIDAEITRASTARFHFMRARVYAAMEQYAQAHESVQNAVRMRNNIPEYFVEAANLAVRVKKYDIALDNINRAIRLEPYQLELYLKRASILRMNQRFDDARNDINFYFKYLPDDTKALFQMGMAEIDAGNTSEGIAYFTILIDSDRSTPEYFIARADARLKSNNYEHAGDDLSQALDLDPTIPEAWHKKGIVLQHENKITDACYCWRKALNMGYREAADYIYRFCIR